MNSNSKLLPQDYVVATELEDGEGVIVDLNSQRYYQLNETAMFIWKLMEKGKTREQIVEEMTRVYEVTGEHAAASLASLVKEFEARKFVAPA